MQTQNTPPVDLKLDKGYLWLDNQRILLADLDSVEYNVVRSTNYPAIVLIILGLIGVLLNPLLGVSLFFIGLGWAGNAATRHQLVLCLRNGTLYTWAHPQYATVREWMLKIQQARRQVIFQQPLPEQRSQVQNWAQFLTH
ncbi:hypothetical protein [Eisenibacter elegans]|uniref:hypothetical protein n=1 Tax=Eisenibacter elegans TaxID=997 RepID=UPI00040B85D2|nr:hypothetical protein [Eisenibacter elegans]